MRKLLVGAVLLGLLVLGARAVHDLLHRHGSAVQAVASHPMPPLFHHAEMAPYTPRLDRQAAEAATVMNGWWSAHGTRPQDKTFAAWLKGRLPRPPSAASRKAEATPLEKLAETRSASGAKAARWLKQYGARDLWLYYEHKQATRLTKTERNVRHRQLTRVLNMSKHLGMSLGADASTASTAAGSTFLACLYPQRAALYRHMADEYEYARLYDGSRLPSDLDAGRLLGDMVAEYFLVTRSYGSVQQVTAATTGGSSHARSAGAAGSTSE